MLPFCRFRFSQDAQAGRFFANHYGENSPQGRPSATKKPGRPLRLARLSLRKLRYCLGASLAEGCALGAG